MSSPPSVTTDSLPAHYPTSTLDHEFRVLVEGLIERLRGGELEADVERLRRFFFKPWAALYELYLSPNADPTKLERWREAPAHSPDRCKAAYDRACRRSCCGRRCAARHLGALPVPHARGCVPYRSPFPDRSGWSTLPACKRLVKVPRLRMGT